MMMYQGALCARQHTHQNKCAHHHQCPATMVFEIDVVMPMSQAAIL